jgi:hypothetical protein
MLVGTLMHKSFYGTAAGVLGNQMKVNTPDETPEMAAARKAQQALADQELTTRIQGDLRDRTFMRLRNFGLSPAGPAPTPGMTPTQIQLANIARMPAIGMFGLVRRELAAKAGQ